MEVKQYKLPGLADAGSIALADDVFDVKYNEGLVWQAITAYLAGGRSGSKANLSRSEVRGGGIKPWRQKGLGRARAGSNTSPLWRTGGVTFAAKPRSFKVSMPKKMYRAAMKSFLSNLLRNEVLKVVDDISVTDHKTKTALKMLDGLTDKPLLLVVDNIDSKLELAVRNLPKVILMDVRKSNMVALAKAKNILVTASAIMFFQEWLA